MKILKKLYRTDSPSGKEQALADWICSWMRWMRIHHVQDAVGNILITKGRATTYPCVVAHLDEVQDPRPEDFKIKFAGDVIYGFSETKMQQRGLGADDKNGVWIAMKLIQRLPSIKVCLFVGEESGCYGSNRVDMDFFSNVRFVIQPDRKNGNDFINKAAGTPLCTQEFMEAMDLEKFGYKPCSGLLTDVLVLRERGLGVSSCNVSCGYHFPHTGHEVTRFSELKNCLAFVENACKTITTVQSMPLDKPLRNCWTSYFEQDDLGDLDEAFKRYLSDGESESPLGL